MVLHPVHPVSPPKKDLPGEVGKNVCEWKNCVC